MKTSTTYGSILTSPNRLKDVKAKLAAPVPIGKIFLYFVFIIIIIVIVILLSTKYEL